MKSRRNRNNKFVDSSDDDGFGPRPELRGAVSHSDMLGVGEQVQRSIENSQRRRFKKGSRAEEQELASNQYLKTPGDPRQQPRQYPLTPSIDERQQHKFRKQYESDNQVLSDKSTSNKQS